MLQKSYLDFRTGVRIFPTSSKTDALGKPLPGTATNNNEWTQKYLDNKKNVKEFESWKLYFWP